MKTVQKARQGVLRADPTWKALYAAGGAAVLLYVVMVIIPIVLVFVAWFVVVGWRLYRLGRSG